MDAKLLLTIIAIAKKEAGAVAKDNRELERTVTAKLQEYKVYLVKTEVRDHRGQRVAKG